MNKFNDFNIFALAHFNVGLSKFAKLARSVTRSRQFGAHMSNIKDPSKQSNLAQVSQQKFIKFIFLEL